MRKFWQCRFYMLGIPCLANTMCFFQEVAEVSESIRHALEAPARSSPSAGADTSASATRVAAADSPDQDLLHGLQVRGQSQTVAFLRA